MKSWYLTKEQGSLFHGGEAIEPDKKIFLTEDQAKLHGDKIESCEPPAELIEVGVKSEWEEFANEKTYPQHGRIELRTERPQSRPPEPDSGDQVETFHKTSVQEPDVESVEDEE